MASKELPVSKALIYCALCKSKLKKSERNLFCPKCKNKFKFPLDQSPDEVEKQFQKKMKYCYNCSEKLFVDDDSVVCIDGCELIDISLETPEAEEPQETMDEKSISKQKEDKEGETSKTKDGEIRDPPLSSIQLKKNEDDASGNKDSPPLNGIQQQKNEDDASENKGSPPLNGIQQQKNKDETSKSKDSPTSSSMKNEDETSKSKDSPTSSSMKNEDETSENKDSEMQEPPVSSKDEKITNETKKPDLSVNAKQQHKTEQDSSKDALHKDLQDTTTEEETFYDAPDKPAEKEKAVQGQRTDITPSSETSQQDSTNSKDQPPHEKNPPKEHPLQPVDVKQNGLRPTDDSHIRSNGDVITNQPKTEKTFSYDDPPDFEVIESVIAEISRKWWMIGEKLGLRKNELSALQMQPDDKSLRDVLNRWTETRRKPYTWDTFLVALRSSDVDMKEVADNIESMLFGYDIIRKGEEEEEEVGEEEHQEHLEDDRLDPNIPVNQFIFKRGKDDRHKLCPSNILVKDCVTIRMHTILDLKAWNAKPQDVMRLSTISHKIDKGNRSFCKFKRIDESEDYIIFQSLVPIPKDFMSKHKNKFFFRYKYIVRVGEEKVVEDLGIGKWRVIEITQWIREATSPTNHFDTVVLPSAAFEGWTLRGMFKDTKKEVIYMGTYQSLKVYFSFGVKVGWLTMKTHDFTIEAKNKAVCLSSVFKNLKQQLYKLPRTDEPGILEIDATLDKELLTLFSSMLDSMEGFQKFLTGMIIAEFILQCTLFSMDCFRENIKMTKSILKCFAIPVNEFQKFCKLMRRLDREFMQNTLEMIVKVLCDAVIEDSVLHHEWMEVLPFLHTIRSNDFSPEKPVTLPHDASAVCRAMFCGLNMNKFISRITKESKFMINSFHCTRPYFDLDWLLPRAWIFTCPFEEFNCIASYPSLSPFTCWVLSQRIDTILQNGDKTGDMLNIIHILLNHIEARGITMDDEVLCYKGVNTISRLIQNTNYSLEVFKASVELFLTVVSKLQWEDKRQCINGICTVILQMMKQLYGEVPTEYYFKYELKEWNDFLLMRPSEVDIQLDWVKEIGSRLHDRINQLQLKDQTKLLTSPSVQLYTPQVKKAIQDSIFKTMKNTPHPDQETSGILDWLIGGSSDETLALLGGIIFSIYGKDYEVTFASLFNSIWPKCLEVYEVAHKGIGGFTEEEQFAIHKCIQAKTILIGFLRSLEKREMKLKELEEIEKAGNVTEMKDIISSFLSIPSIKKEVPTMTVEVLDCEISAANTFKERNKKLLHFAHVFADFAEAETKKIKESLQTFDYSSLPIRDLWENEESKIVYKYGQASDIPERIMEEVFQLTHSEGCTCVIFQNLWSQRKSTYMKKQSGTTSTLDVVIKDLWTPVCEEFKSDLKKLSTLQLPLDKVTLLFENIFEQKILEGELNKWCDATGHPRRDWIRETAQKILEYQQFCRYSYTAKTLMQLKETLGLTGDFSVVEALSAQESSSKEQVTLATVEETATIAGVLKDIAEHPKRRACLETFCSCIELVEWIRVVANSVGQLQHVVQIANQTMEGDLIKQLLLDLLTFGSAFAPLIYDVSPTESCEALINRCKSLWTFVDEHPKLREISESCNKRLGELQRVQENLSDFQRSNVEQMHLINKRGLYSISAIPGKILHSIEEAVCMRMRLSGSDDPSEKTVFKLDDIKELQSKLALVAAENADSVSRFNEMLSKMERIAEILVKLQESGNVDYTHFTLECGCSEYKKDELDKKIAEMDEALCSWQKRVQSHRKKYPHLNYFTSQQLLDLQQELGKLKKDTESQASVKLMQLLLSVTPQPTHEKIVTSLKHATETVQAAKSTQRSGRSSASPARGILFSTAQFNYANLKHEQKVIYNTLIKEDGYKTVVVVNAFQEVGEDADEDDLREWCMDNEHKYKDDDSDVHIITETVTTDHEEKEEITEDHPLVKELVEDGYDVNIALKAVEYSKGDPEKAAPEIALALQLGKSPEDPKQDGSEWRTPARYTQIPLTIKLNVPEGEYLSLIELGEMLNELAFPSPSEKNKGITEPRKLRKFIVLEGKKNLIAVDRWQMWKAVLFLYMASPHLPMPTYEEIVVCTEDTTVEEITLLWHRAVNDEGKKRLFCLVNADKLPYNVSEEVLNNLEVITQGSDEFKIAILISTKEQAKSHIASRLSGYIRKLPILPSDTDITEYIKSHCKAEIEQRKDLTGHDKDIQSSLELNVGVVLSTRSGMGKSLRIERMKALLPDSINGHSPYVCVPIHGPDVSVRYILEQMEHCMQNPTAPFPQIVHFNVAISVLEQIDWFLFKILILGGLADNFGNIWKKSVSQICIVECTLPKLDISDGCWSIKGSSVTELPSTYSLLSYLPQTICGSPKQVEASYGTDNKEGIVQMDELTFRSPHFQRVYQYLRRVKQKQKLDKFSYDTDKETVEGKPNECLTCILESMKSDDDSDHDSDVDPSWAEVRNFIQFLNSQLHDCEQSPYCGDPGFTSAGLKEFVVKFAILMAKEFTRPSLNIAKASEDIGSITEENLKELYSVASNRSWDECPHPYLFFNQDGHTMTFMGLWVDKDGNLIDVNSKMVIQKQFMTKNLRQLMNVNKVELVEEYNKWKKPDMILKLTRVLGINENKYMGSDGKLDLTKIDPDPSYVLTVDNVMKMLAIDMKFRCGIPVIMMGETGCGKTRLLRYLCELQEKVFKVKTLLCLKVHGGTNERRIEDAMDMAITHAKNNKKQYGGKVYTVLFFDEVNTTEAIGLIKEVICDRTILGQPIPDELKFAAACNPYKIHDEETIKSLQNAGLGFYLRDEERIPKLGNIPLRKLVYRVLPLPPSMYQFVYDFGQVSGKAETTYIEKIVNNHLKESTLINTTEHDKIKDTVTNVLVNCQVYMRNQNNECKYVSLRDIVRAMILFKWFLTNLRNVEVLKSKIQEKVLKDLEKLKNIEDKESYEASVQQLNDVTRALLYAVTVSYYARLTDRPPFLKAIVPHFTTPYCLPGKNDEEKCSFFENEIMRIQSVFLDAMNVPSNIAHNAALRENVFMITVCIENRLPLFIVGKPGSSKSLAKSIVANSMQGKYSSNDLLKQFKRVHAFPYQCNQFSTTSTLVELFEEAMKFQVAQGDFNNSVSVVVLEEIGLAEDTPGLPLKVLHPYLEDGTAGTKPDEQDVKPEERVAFIGISNWALDPAKMNRGIMVIRCPPVQEELLQSAFGIANMISDAFQKEELTKSFEPLASMYRNICKKQEECGDDGEEEGREFFGLRDFYTMIKMLCWKCIESNEPPSKAVYRHAILRNFSGHSRIKPLEEIPNASSLVSLHQEDHEALTLIQASLETFKLSDNDSTKKGDVKKENRYLLFITENQSALRILHTRLLEKEKPYVFYGSSFPKDKQYTQVCMNINKIKICMEKGIPVVLLNYEQIYESLYDVLNQCYTELPTGRYVDLGLRSYRIKCRVHPNFRLIIIAEKNRVFTQFPIALINRLEKHFVVSETILSSKQKKLATQLDDWAVKFSCVGDDFKRFSITDAFVGYKGDTAASIILYASQVVSEDLPDDEWEKEMMKIGIACLLHTASVDAMARLRSRSAKCDPDVIKEAYTIYFDEQEHFSLTTFLDKQVTRGYPTGGLLVQITTYGPLLTQKYKEDLSSLLAIKEDDIHLCQLPEFDTEMDFVSEISGVFEATSAGNKLLIIQCEYSEDYTDLIACARHRITDARDPDSTKACGDTHVLFIVQLPRVAGGTSFTSFQGGSWVSTHIDELTCPEGANKVVNDALTSPLHKFFDMLIQEDSTLPTDFRPCTRVKENVQLAVARIVSQQTYSQMERVIDTLLKLITDSVPPETDGATFSRYLLLRVRDLLKQRDDTLLQPDLWAVETALDRHKLQASFTLVNSIKRLLDTYVQRVLSYIVHHIDVCDNLSLLTTNEEDNSCLHKLWLCLFKDQSFLPFEYQDIATSSVPVTNIKARKYSCRFPFSREIIDQIEPVLSKVILNSREEKSHVFHETVDALKNLSFCEYISNVPPELSSDFYKRYLHDYINNLSLPFDEEIIESVQKMLQVAFTTIANTFEPAITSGEPFPLINGIAAVHVAYNTMEKEIFWLAELSDGFPELPSTLQETDILSSEKVIFHLIAVKYVTQKLAPERKQWDAESTKTWVLDFHSNKSTVESLLSLVGHDEKSETILIESRKMWQKIQAMDLLAEHVITPESDIPNKYVNLSKYFGLIKKINFSEKKILQQTLRMIQAILKTLPVTTQPKCELCKRVLKVMEIQYIPCAKNHIYCTACFQNSLESKGYRCPNCTTPIPRQKDFTVPEMKRKEYELFKEVQRHCLDFFMETVSQCCFSPIGADKPNDDFFKFLLEIVTDTQNLDYIDLFPIDEEYTHSCPIARSVLLQLLLEYNPQEVKTKLQSYQDYIKKTHGNEYVIDDQELTLLCIKCLEDRLHKQNAQLLEFDEKLRFVIECMKKSESILTDGELVRKYEETIPVEYMDCIAQVRFGLCYAAKIFFEFYCFEEKQDALSRATKENLEKLRDITQKVIKGGILKEPLDFLIKQVVRQYGFPYLDKLGQLPEFTGWLVPKTKGGSQDIDPFVIVGEDYTSLRAKWVLSPVPINHTEAEQELKASPVSKHIAAVLTLFRRISTQSEKAAHNGQNELLGLRKECHTFSGIKENIKKSLTTEGSQVIEGSQIVETVRFSPWERNAEKSLAAIVVHFATIVATVSENKMFTPFFKILTCSDGIENMYWPTMPDNILDIVIAATAGTRDTWWKCPNGHDYFVQNCGRPVVGEVKKCFCGAPIGGKATHVAQEDNIKVADKPLKEKGLTKQGHCLELPRERSSVPSPQRELSGISNCLMRILLHSVCIWAASSNDKDICNRLASIIVQDKPIAVEDVLQYFWHNLERDFQVLSRAAQQSFDDCTLFVHTFIHKISDPMEVKIETDTNLPTRQAREHWEKLFDETFIQPFTQDLNTPIEDARRKIVDDCNQDHRALFQMIYETASIESTNITPHLWIYRPQITIEHVAQSLEKDTSVTADLSVLREFLKNVNLLVSLQYLPDIVRLQRNLYEMCHHRIDQNEAKSTFKDFVQNHVTKAHQREKMMRWADSFCSAWNTVKQEIATLVIVPVPAEYIIHMTVNQPLAFFIPMRRNEGICSTALTHYLAMLQNNFIELSWKKLHVGSMRTKHHVSLEKLQDGQIIDFEHQISHVVFSHCKYSLKAGRGADVSYDFTALEKHILDRFVRGKPFMTCNVPLMSYRSDVLQAQTFNKIRKSIQQTPIPQKDKNIILQEIQDKQGLQQCIDIVNVALGFVQYSSWKHTAMLDRYMTSLKMQGLLPNSIQQQCQLTHIISLWRILNVEQARRIAIGKEDPFPDVGQAFKKPLDEEEIKKLNIELGPYDMDQFLEFFYEFIVTQVKKKTEIEAEDCLVDAYLDVCDYFEVEKIPSFAERFPPQFSLEHVTAIWKHAVSYQQEQKNNQEV